MTPLEKAAAIFREREAEWRAIEEQGGRGFHTEEAAYARALEAMTCADIIDEMIGLAQRE